jgi:chemotaxis signal transduction protein
MRPALRASLDARLADGDAPLAFGLGGHPFAVPGHQVAEVASVPTVVSVPSEDPTVLGVVLHRDQVVAVVDLGRRLGARAGGPGALPWLCLFVRTDLGTMAFPIDRVLTFGVASGAPLPDDVEILNLESA